MRCLAIAQAWNAAGGSVRVACTVIPESLAKRYAVNGVAVDRRDTWSASATAQGSAAVIADSPYLSDRALADLAAEAPALVTIDDSGWRNRYPGTIVFNQNAHASARLYAGKTDAQLCLGTGWCLLRAEFARWCGVERDFPDQPKTLLLMMGGADPERHSALLLEAALEVCRTLDPAPTVVLVVGAANDRLEALRRQAAVARTSVSVLHDVQEMPPLLASADLAVSAAGSTTWELAAVGTPMILGAQNDTEVGPAAAMVAHGAAKYLGPFNQVTLPNVVDLVSTVVGDAGLRRRMSNAARRLVDGKGAARLTALIASLLDSDQAENS